MKILRLRKYLQAIIVLAVILIVPASAAATPMSSSMTTSGTNPWLNRRVLNIAHQGGEIEAPSDTLVGKGT